MTEWPRNILDSRDDEVSALKQEIARLTAELAATRKHLDVVMEQRKEAMTKLPVLLDREIELQERVRSLWEFVKAWDEWLSPSNYSTQAPRLFDELKRKRAALGEDGGNG